MLLPRTEHRLTTLNTTKFDNLKKLSETGLSAASPHGIPQTAEPTVFKVLGYVTSGVTIF
jgi:2,3-bisphosphoglycerate-independent phosphoglycerate mutase